MSAAAAAREPTTGATPSSSSSSASPSSSSSSDDNDADPDYRVDASDDDVDYRAATSGKDGADVVHLMPADAEGVVSSLHTQAKVDTVCKKYGVPMDQYTARPAAGHMRASSAPPPAAICVYAQALEAGMRVPLHGSKSMNPSVYDPMKNIRAEKAAATQASASANKVKYKPGSDATAKSSPLCGKKRRLDEADGKEGEGPPPFPLDCLLPSAEEPSDVATPSFAGINLKAAHNTISSLEELLEQANGELAVVKAELAASKRAAVEREKANVDLAAAKRRAEAELKKVKAELAAVKAAGKCAAGER